MTDGEPDRFVCSRVEDGPMPLPGCIQTNVCSQCAHAVWTAPTGQQTLREHPELVIYCTRCAIAAMKSGDEIMQPTTAQWVEIIGALRRN